MKLIKTSLVAASALACSASLYAMPMSHNSRLAAQVNSLQKQVNTLMKHHSVSVHNHVSEKAGMSSVMLNASHNFDGSSTIAWQPSYNLNYTLLKREAGMGDVTSPRMELSGDLGFDAYHVSNTAANDNQLSTFRVGTAMVDANVAVSPWVSAFVSLGIDKGSFAETKKTSQNLDYLAFQQAFVTLGNLNRSRMFASFGQMYVPFGRYASATVIDPLTDLLFQTQETAAEVGYAHHGVLVEGYLYKGDSNLAANNSKDKMYQYGANVQYTHIMSHGQWVAGAGYISNVGDSNGLTALVSSANKDRVGGYDLHLCTKYKRVDLFLEYITTTKKFDSGATDGKIAAYDSQLAYHFAFKGKPMSVGVGYGATQNARQVSSQDYGMMPKDMMSVFLDGSIWKNTGFKAQYARANYYSGHTKDDSNVFAGEFDVYF